MKKLTAIQNELKAPNVMCNNFGILHYEKSKTINNNKM